MIHALVRGGGVGCCQVVDQLIGTEPSLFELNHQVVLII
jgi:hypothetical protein